MVDRDGSESLSRSVEVRMDGLSVAELGAAQPNPSTGVATLGFTTDGTSGADVRLYDGLGREVLLLYNGAAASGVVTVDGTQLESGLYRVVLRSGSAQIVRPLQIVR